MIKRRALAVRSRNLDPSTPDMLLLIPDSFAADAPNIASTIHPVPVMLPIIAGTYARFLRAQNGENTAPGAFAKQQISTVHAICLGYYNCKNRRRACFTFLPLPLRERKMLTKLANARSATCLIPLVK